MMERIEVREARALIRRPLAALGYELDDEAVNRILGETNYYPVLIQLSCRELLRQVASQRYMPRPGPAGPPFQITLDHVRRAYESEELRQVIRRKFHLTLELDLRYEVLAYAVAYLAACDPTTSHAQGVTIEQIRELALQVYERGFEAAGSSAEDEIQVLLDELVGLGVLRPVAPRCYTLRSSSVARLLGNEDEVERELMRPRDQPPIYKPATFRSTPHATGTDPWRRNPLTASQLTELREASHGIRLIVGSEAAGLADLEPFLTEEFADYLVTIKATDKAGFIARLDDRIRRPRDGTTLVLVDAGADWDLGWIEVARRKVDALGSRRSFVQFAFVADPGRLLRLLDVGAEPEAIRPMSLRPWHETTLHYWLEDCKLPTQDKDRITQATGRWPLLLYEVVQIGIEEVQGRLADPTGAEQYLRMLGVPGAHSAEAGNGLHGDLSRLLLDTLELLGGVQGADTEAFLEFLETEHGVGRDRSQRLLRWADLLQLLRPAEGFSAVDLSGERTAAIPAIPQARIRLDPLVGRLLGAARGPHV